MICYAFEAEQVNQVGLLIVHIVCAPGRLSCLQTRTEQMHKRTTCDGRRYLGTLQDWRLAARRALTSQAFLALFAPSSGSQKTQAQRGPRPFLPSLALQASSFPTQSACISADICSLLALR